MIKIGRYKLLISETLLVLEGNDLEIEINDDDDINFKIKINFEKDSNNPEPTFEAKLNDNSGLLVFKNWSDGMSFKSPVQLAKLNNGKELSLLVQTPYVGELSQIIIQIMTN